MLQMESRGIKCPGPLAVTGRTPLAREKYSQFEMPMVPSLWVLTDGCQTFKGLAPQTSQPLPHFSEESAKHTNDPAACKSVSFHCRPPKVDRENGSDLDLRHQKGQMSKEIINSTWATSAPTQWKGTRTNLRKGHKDQGSQQKKARARGYQLQQASMWS